LSDGAPGVMLPPSPVRLEVPAEIPEREVLQVEERPPLDLERRVARPEVEHLEDPRMAPLEGERLERLLAVLGGREPGEDRADEREPLLRGKLGDLGREAEGLGRVRSLEAPDPRLRVLANGRPRRGAPHGPALAGRNDRARGLRPARALGILRAG